MTSADRWKEISSLFNAALEQPPDGRAAFLESACPDAAVRAQVAARRSNIWLADVIER